MTVSERGAFPRTDARARISSGAAVSLRTIGAGNRSLRQVDLTGEFDPGSERTLAACLTHASRAGKFPSGSEYSGERVSNT